MLAKERLGIICNDGNGMKAGPIFALSSGDRAKEFYYMTFAKNIEALPQPNGGDYELARFNALRHGILSQYTVLPWEDREEYRALLEALVGEHHPRGPTEEHLVEELAGVIWRKRRLRIGESAAHHRALERASDRLRTQDDSRARLAENCALRCRISRVDNLCSL
jgi:hypothetical protein